MKFGTSGLRGLVADLEGPSSFQYSAAFAHHLIESGLAKRGSAIVVGRDFRSSSPAISASAISAISDAGFCVIDCGTLPTPAIAYYGLKLEAASLVVTGSHIPDDRNGIKFFRPDGEITKADEASISRTVIALKQRGFDTAHSTNSSAINRSTEAEALFASRNEGLLTNGALKGLKIGVYQHSTVARDLFVRVLQSYGAELVILGRSEHFIPVDTEAVSAETISKLRAWAFEHKLDAIVSADGDGDRPLLADEAGNPLRGDLLGLITARFLGAAVVVTPVTSNSGIEVAGAKNNGFETVRTKVGSPFVVAGMQEAIEAGKAGIMGFEANGGVLTGSKFTINGKQLDPLPTRDSFLPILATLSFAAGSNLSLSQIADEFSMPYAASDRLEYFPVDVSTALMAYLRSDQNELATFIEPIGLVESVSDIDGLRITLNENRIIHLRPSGNAPEMRCYVEAPDEAVAKALLAHGLELISGWASRIS